MQKWLTSTAIALALALPGAALAQQAQPGQEQEQMQMQQPGQETQQPGEEAQQQQAQPQQQEEMGQQPMPQQQMGQPAQPQQPEALMPAGDIVGRQVMDAQGIDLGQIAHIVLDMQSGGLLYALIQPPMAPERLVIMPWQALVIPESVDQPLQAQVSVAQLAQGVPAIERQRLQDLTQPIVQTQITEYYRLAPPQQGQTGPNLVVVDREAVRTVLPPPVPIEETLRGATVETAQDQPLGAIRDVVIDPRHGRVAYVLVEPGTGEQQAQMPEEQEQPAGQPQAEAPEQQAEAPAQEEQQATEQARAGETVRVPYAALQWQTDQGNFQVAGDVSPEQMPTAPLADTGMDREQLSELYEQYGVQPYWQ